MIALQDIRSLTDFQRNTKAHLKRLKATGRPAVLTVNGKAAGKGAWSYDTAAQTVRVCAAEDKARKKALTITLAG